MSKMLDYLKAAGGQASLATRLGFWRQAVSLTVDQLVELVNTLSGGGLLPATGTTTGARPLSGYNTTLLQTGDEVFVQGVNELYYYDAASALVADQLDVVDAVGPGQFLRGSTVITQAAWYVDSVAGDDQNDGSVGAPIKTLGELAKRWSGKVLWSGITNATITLAGTFPTEVLALTGFEVAVGQSLIISSAALTTADSGTITTYTARNAAADTSATILADISFAAHASRRMRLTSGANSGAVAAVLFDLGGNTCRVGVFQSATAGAVVPANGDTFVIETYPTVLGGVTITYSGGGVVRVDDLEVQPAGVFFNVLSPFGFLASGGTFGVSSAFFNRCRFANSLFIVTGGTGFNACIFTAGTTFRHGRYIIQGGAFVGGTNSSWNAVSVLLQVAYLSFEGVASAMTLFEQSTFTQSADLQMFRCSGAAGILVRDGSVFTQTAALSIYGGTNTFTNAFAVFAASSFLYISTKPTVVGSTPGTNDIKLGGVNSGWAGIPSITAANNAMAVVRV